MADLDRIFAASQLPMVVMLAAISATIAARARQVNTGHLNAPSPVMLWLVSAFFFVLFVRFGWWHLRWMLRALDLHAASESMTDRVIFPLVCNVLGLIIGGAILTVAGRETIGRFAAPAVVTGCVGLFVLGAGFAGMLK